MQVDLSVAATEATVKIEQRQADGGRTIGTGFLVTDLAPDGSPRVVLITAEHVLEDMPLMSASIGFRIQDPDSSWSYRPTDLKIRDADGRPLWTRHPERDVAALVVEVAPAMMSEAIPLEYLATSEDFARLDVGLGDELLALGFPRGLSSNMSGFAILRAGRIASYPVGPSDEAPTFLMDFSVFPGNSGGPVFMADRRGMSDQDRPQMIAGILTQQVEVGQERLGIGIVTHARYVRETLERLDGKDVPVSMAAQQGLTGVTAIATESVKP